MHHLRPLSRNLFLVSVAPMPIIGIAVGCILAVLFGDPWGAAHVRLRYAMFSLAHFLVVVAALSMSTYWLEMVDRVQLGQRRNANTIVSSESIRSVSPAGGVPYSIGALGMALISFLITGTLLVAFFNPAMMSFMFLAIMLVVGGSFILASKRINAALVRVLPVTPSQSEFRAESALSSSISTEESSGTTLRAPLPVRSIRPTQPLEPTSVPPSVQVLVEEVRKVAQGVGIRCMAISCSGIAFGLCRPSPSPVYAQQNTLPPWLSGQIAYFLLAASTVETSACIASDIRLWSNRQHDARPAPANTLPRLSFRKLAVSHLWALMSNVVEQSESIKSKSSSLTNTPASQDAMENVHTHTLRHGDEISQEFLEGAGKQ